MKNALILHGAGNNSQGNWFPWLGKELNNRGFQVWIPNLPNSDVPNQNSWLKEVFSNKNWIFDKDSILIGHSSGATLILRILEMLQSNVRVDKALLVAAPAQLVTKQEYFKYKKDLLKMPFDWPKIKESCDKFYFIYSDNDQYECGVENGDLFQKYLGGELILKPGQGHFNLEKSLSYKEFPELLRYIED